LTLSYEELVVNPRNCLTPVCRALGLEFETAMLEYGGNADLMHAYQRATMGDKNVLQSRTVHAASVGGWRSILTPDEVARVLRTLGSRLFEDTGYLEQLHEAATYAGLEPSDIEKDGSLLRLFATYQAYARITGESDQLTEVTDRADVQYTLLGQQNEELHRAADERLRLIQRLDRELAAARTDADAKERLIVEQRATLDEQRRVIVDLENGILGPETPTNLLLEQTIAAQQQMLELIVANLQAAAAERTRFLERFEQQDHDFHQLLSGRHEDAGRQISHVGAAQRGQATPDAPPSGQPGAPSLTELAARVSSIESDLANQFDALARLSGDLTVDRQVRLLQQQVEAAQATAEARLAVIEQQRRAIDYYRRWRPADVLSHWTAPRIGQLYQYPPRPMVVPDRYRKVKPLAAWPTISIVTPSFNQGHFIERTIKSVLTQNYPNLEYIVKDAGSTDETREVLSRYESHLSHVESAADGGFASGINQGFEHASGEIMAYLNSDDLLLPGTLQFVARIFANDPRVDVVYGHRVVIDEYDAEIGRWVLPQHDDEVLSWADYVPQETLFWRSTIWERVGGAIDESFRFAIDWDLLVRFRDSGAHMRRLPRFLGAFRVHPHQKTSVQMQEIGQQEMDRIRERCHGRVVTPTEIDRAVRPYLRRHFVHHKLYRLGLLRY
jgi:hypothetical protein